MKIRSVVLGVSLGMVSAVSYAADFDLTPYADADAVVELGLAEIASAGNFGNTDGNTAFIVQSAGGATAFIDQREATLSFAVISQPTAGGVAMIYQVGDANRAVIAQ